ncbi:hypothetical protein DFR58_13322 [Anaerobacterium chartisolvens]|uniref:Fibronectin type-III domain-containing protein n=1 Tax=Anaerobacterium chartisolvens TaxID=1297424 RepID=A0A369AL87_9FIRM|nr:hypothetical protein [Anaerobacterium chartisolvens]RCX09883.1 hypothetical protein DFR58_13322 [Anaerobacterium chartisolvens]
MRKRGTAKIFVGLLAMIMVLSVLCVNAFAATVGEQLTSPEEGWQRYDHRENKILYLGNSWREVLESDKYQGASIYIPASASSDEVRASSIKFRFKGSKLRILDGEINTRSKEVGIKIDKSSVYSYSSYSTSTTGTDQVILFEITDLPFDVHTVEIYSIDGIRYGLDAIDIDDTGELLLYYEVSNLTAAPGNAAVALSWDAVEDAVSYNIKRSTTPDGPYATIATGVTGTAYTDATVTNGTTYYYVVSAVTASGQSANSNEASATPEAPPAIGNSAILEITVTTGVIKEYDVTAAELQDFLSWYDGSSSGADKAYYIFTKKNNIAPFLSRKEYLAFDKIVSFEVKEYED